MRQRQAIAAGLFVVLCLALLLWGIRSPTPPTAVERAPRQPTVRSITDLAAEAGVTPNHEQPTPASHGDRQVTGVLKVRVNLRDFPSFGHTVMFASGSSGPDGLLPSAAELLLADDDVSSAYRDWVDNDDPMSNFRLREVLTSKARSAGMFDSAYQPADVSDAFVAMVAAKPKASETELAAHEMALQRVQATKALSQGPGDPLWEFATLYELQLYSSPGSQLRDADATSEALSSLLDNSDDPVARRIGVQALADTPWIVPPVFDSDTYDDIEEVVESLPSDKVSYMIASLMLKGVLPAGDADEIERWYAVASDRAPDRVARDMDVMGGVVALMLESEPQTFAQAVVAAAWHCHLNVAEFAGPSKGFWLRRVGEAVEWHDTPGTVFESCFMGTDFSLLPEPEQQVSVYILRTHQRALPLPESGDVEEREIADEMTRVPETKKLVAPSTPTVRP